MIYSISALLCASLVASASVSLAKFDGSKEQHVWVEENDPVMGGQSTNCTFTVDKIAKVAVFQGEVKIVPKLKAPGFCFARTVFTSSSDYADASAFPMLSFVVRNPGPLTAFKAAFAADTFDPQFDSFKADITIPVSADFQTVHVPFSTFSNKWDPSTGEPKGVSPPSAKNLKDISQLQIWAEGTASKFHLEVQEILASDAPEAVCSKQEYCCPDAKHCLYPTGASCAVDACATGLTCCPLTKLCVKVGVPCVTPCSPSEYCCPDALHCLTPVNPGVFCNAKSPCKANQTCCPLTNICVTVGPVCTPP